MNAIVLKRVLIVILVALAVGCVGSHIVLLQRLNKTVIDTDHAKIDAEISNSDIDHLKTLQGQLAKSQDVIARTKEIVATSADYKYQDQIITDINHLAADSGVTVTGFSFPASATTTGSTSTVSSGSAALPATVPGAKLITITITMRSPMPYDNYLKFLRSLELNLTRLQVTGIDLSPDPNNSTLITNPSIGIQIYVKS